MRQSDISKMVKAFQSPKRWSQHAEARTERGQPCHYNDPNAWIFSLDGLMFKLFGPEGAMERMLSLSEGLRLRRANEFNTLCHATSFRDPTGAALTMVMDFNDTSSFAEIRHRLLNLEPYK